MKKEQREVTAGFAGGAAILLLLGGGLSLALVSSIALRFLQEPALDCGMRRVGFIATLAAGVGLLGASLHGMTTWTRR